MFLRKTILGFFGLFLVCVTVCAQEQQSSKAQGTDVKDAPVQTTSATPTPEPLATDQANDRLPFMAETARENQESAPSTGGLMLRTLGALLLIVGLIIAAAWGMKRFGGARFGKAAEDAPQLAILNTVALGDKRSVAVIRFAERTLLIGSTAQSITLLAESTNEPVLSDLPSVAEMLGETSAITFADELSAAESGGQFDQW